MSNTAPPSTETSVTFSLAELGRLEQERVREEDAQRARAREREAREKREAEARARAEEEARIKAEEEARGRRVRAEAEEAARAEARLRAAADVARIEAESRARIEAANAARAHELAMLRVEEESGKRRLRFALAAVIGLAVSGGGLTAHQVSRHTERLTLDVAQAREAREALARERESAKQTELAALDRRRIALEARPTKGAEEARASVEAARRAVDRKALDHDRLRALADALDVLGARLDTLDRLAGLDARRDDLLMMADKKQLREPADTVKTASVRARALADDAAIRGYEAALAELRDALGRTSTARAGAAIVKGEKGTSCIDPNDPMCAFNGKSL